MDGNDRDRVAPSRPITTSKVEVVRLRREMMMDSLARLNTHADPGMGRVSANVARRWIREPPYEGVGSGRNYQADWAHVDPGARGSGDELRPRRVRVLRKERPTQSPSSR